MIQLFQSAGGCAAICLSCHQPGCCLEREIFQWATNAFLKLSSLFQKSAFFAQILWTYRRYFHQVSLLALTFALISTRNLLLLSSVSFLFPLYCSVGFKKIIWRIKAGYHEFFSFFLISHLSSSRFQEWNLDSCCHLASLTYSPAALAFRVVKVCKMLKHHLDWVQVLNNGDYIYKLISKNNNKQVTRKVANT